MTSTLRPIRHEDRLSLVEHLDELRTRLIICITAFVICFGVCLWQDDVILDTINRPLEQTAFKDKEGSTDPFERTAAFQAQLRRSAVASAQAFYALGRRGGGAESRRLYEGLAAQNRALAPAVPPQPARKPVTLGVGEPFLATVRVAAYAALLLCLPLLLFQAYAFILPAFSREERRVALPLMMMVPFLFLAGVVFAYYMVLPNAIDFLQNFNDDNYDILLQAKDYYRFAITVLIAMGIAFQVPVGILAITRVGIISVAQLRKSRRYAILVIAVVTMLSPMLPLYVLFESSILLASLLDRRAARKESAEQESSDDLEP